jgi:hypothetical protein
VAASGGSGFLLGKSRRGWLLDRKKKRMAIIGTNGLLVMIPAALFLQSRAAAGDFDASYGAGSGTDRRCRSACSRPSNLLISLTVSAFVWYDLLIASAILHPSYPAG